MGKMGVPVWRWRSFFRFESHCFADSAGADCCRWGLFLRVREEAAFLIICLAARWWGFERIGQGQVALMLRPGSFRFHVLLVWIPVGLALIVDRNPMRRLILRDSRTGFRGRWGGRRDPFAWMHHVGRTCWNYGHCHHVGRTSRVVGGWRGYLFVGCTVEGALGRNV